MPEYVYSIILVVVIVVVVMISTKKKKAEVWKGKLEKKRINHGDEDTMDTYRLIFRTDEGKESNPHLFRQVCYVVGVSHRNGILPQTRDSVKGNFKTGPRFSILTTLKNVV